MTNKTIKKKNMKRISFLLLPCIFLSLLLSVSFLFSSCDKDEDNGEVLSSTMWRNDSCTVTLPFIFSTNAVVQHDNSCDVVLNGNKITVLTKETLGTSRIVIEEQGKGKATVSIEVVMPNKNYRRRSAYTIIPELDDDAMIVVNRYINENIAASLDFENNLVVGYNEENKIIFSGNYEYYRGKLTIHKDEGKTMNLKVNAITDISLFTEQDITEAVKALIPDAPAEKYSPRGMYLSYI